MLSETSLLFPVKNLTARIVVMYADIGQCLLFLNIYTFAGCVTVTLYHIVTGIFF